MIFDELAEAIEREKPFIGNIDLFTELQKSSVFDCTDPALFASLCVNFDKTFGAKIIPVDTREHAVLMESMFLPFDPMMVCYSAKRIGDPSTTITQAAFLLLGAYPSLRGIQLSLTGSGRLQFFDIVDMFTKHGSLCSGVWDSDKRSVIDTSSVMRDEVIYKIVSSAQINTAVLLWSINHPRLFVVENAPAKPRPYSGIKNCAHRSVYTVLHLTEIVKKYGLTGQDNGGTHASPSPHPRRAHLAVLRSERYTHKRGQTIKIPAVWVGPKEKQVGNRIYRILVDK